MQSACLGAGRPPHSRSFQTYSTVFIVFKYTLIVSNHPRYHHNAKIGAEDFSPTPILSALEAHSIKYELTLQQRIDFRFNSTKELITTSIYHRHGFRRNSDFLNLNLFSRRSFLILRIRIGLRITKLHYVTRRSYSSISISTPYQSVIIIKYNIKILLTDISQLIFWTRIHWYSIPLTKCFIALPSCS